MGNKGLAQATVAFAVGRVLFLLALLIVCVLILVGWAPTVDDPPPAWNVAAIVLAAAALLLSIFLARAYIRELRELDRKPTRPPF